MMWTRFSMFLRMGSCKSDESILAVQIPSTVVVMPIPDAIPRKQCFHTRCPFPRLFSKVRD